ncbi:uracil-DNA glycosylase family protein [[Clostridium] innocuum]|nr:uracil-DNA glycosylase family protein [[Clostridium] innocuum]
MEQKQDAFEQLKMEICACRLCADTFEHEPRPIFRGKQKARIMQISQAPSIHVHNSGLPFDDASGKKLRREWYQIEDAQFYDEYSFYITSMGHCYPGKGAQGDKKPPRICARTWLKRELEAVDNELYIIIGAMAARELFPNCSFEELVFRDQRLYGKTALILPHPSPLNVRWMKEHPQFETERLPYIRSLVHAALAQEHKSCERSRDL